MTPAVVALRSRVFWVFAGATALFRAFVPTTLGQPNDSTFEYVMLENHPTIMQRIAMAQAWRARNGR